MIWPSDENWIGYKVPFIGKNLWVANRGLNEAAKEFALENGIPILAGSDAHRARREKAYSIFPREDIDFSSEVGLLSSLKSAIKKNEFEISEVYAKPLDWFRWCGEFVYGHGRMPSPNLTAEYRPGVFEG